jgi:cytochrome P450
MEPSVNDITVTPQTWHFEAWNSSEPPEKSKAELTSLYVSDLLKTAQNVSGSSRHCPVFTLYEYPDTTNRIHSISDPDLQREVEKYHRYGPLKKALNQKNSHISSDSSIQTVSDPDLQREVEKYHRHILDQKTPYIFSDSFVRERVLKIFPMANPLTTYEEESKLIRKHIQTFFNQRFLEDLQKICKNSTLDWVDRMTQKKQIPLFESVSLLVCEFLLKGILGYAPCTEKDIQLNVNVWKKLFSPMPSHLQHVEDLKKNESKGFFSSISQTWSDVLDIQDKCVSYFWELNQLETLVKKIIDYGCKGAGKSNPNLSAYLKDKNVSSELLEGTINIMLLAGLETTSYLLAFILYECAAKPELAKQAESLEGISKIYLEALRMYPTGGAARQANEDMKVVCSSGKNKGFEHVISKGDLISCNPYLAGHDASEWKDPEVFNPDRTSLDQVKLKTVVFGHGAHRCLGEKVAESEILSALSNILPNVKLTALSPLPELVDSLVLKPVHDISVSIEKL